MRWLKYIWIFLLSLGFSPGLHAQYINIVCTGDLGVTYRVQGNPGSTFVWNVQGGTISANYGDSIKVNWGNIPGEYNLRVQEFSKFGCAAAPVSGKVLVSGPLLDLGDDREICQGEVAEILPTGTFYSYLWQDGSTGPNFIARQQGNVSLTVTDQYGCKKTDNLLVVVHPLPNVNLGKDTSLCGIEDLILDGGGDGVQFKWSTGQSSREITVYAGFQKISVEVTNEFGCFANDDITINTCSTVDYFRNMPTAFTPNGDGKNDVWNIPELQAFPQAVVEIYDRWGSLVFRSTEGYSKPWDGNSGGKEMPMDSYYFVITLNSPGLEPIAGTVTLIK
ncbi:MAG: gliding motility-associated C-terminal domain-containing protein [Bacteroidales bacterium]|nr:gliding motility-associated C-terminal domain-containing protein [Bacteroidales bacterium]MCB8999888.1 gliding motility-associated C-terminal domain-containing protein [Bacteroidales bacterium]